MEETIKKVVREMILDGEIVLTIEETNEYTHDYELKIGVPIYELDEDGNKLYVKEVDTKSWGGGINIKEMLRSL